MRDWLLFIIQMKRFQNHLLLTSFLSMILFMNWTYSFSADDCFYGVIYDGEKWTHVGTIWNALMVSIIDLHRPVVHFFARVFAGCFDKWVFNVVNTSVVGVLLLFINRLARRTWKLEPASLAVIIFLVFFVLCKGESYLWCCGSTCYLWAGVMTLGFCILREKLEDDELSTWVVLMLLPIVAAIAAGNEAYSPSICIGIVVLSLMRIRKLNWNKILVYGVYGLVSLACAIYEAKNRAFIDVPDASVNNYLYAIIKIAFAVKCVWVAFLCFIFSKDKCQFVKDNLFEIVVIVTDLVIVMLIGFVPERILWVANMLGIVIVTRSWRPGKIISAFAYVSVIVVFCFLVPLGCKIQSAFQESLVQYQQNPHSILCHERVECGFLGRFFFQIPNQWQPYGYHPEAYSLYYGHPGIRPCALTRELYDGVYKSNDFCSLVNRIPIPIEAYTSYSSNTIVVPIRNGILQNATQVEVVYDYGGGLFAKISRLLNSLGKLRVSHDKYPGVLKTMHGDFYLVAKEPGSDRHIKNIIFTNPEFKDPDNGMWYTADELIKSPLYSLTKKVK